MDHSQVLIRPVVSEKSYVLSAAGKYTFRVHPDAHRTADPPGGGGALRRPRRGRPHRQRQVEAQAARLDARAHAQLEEGDRARCAPARASRSSRGSRASRPGAPLTTPRQRPADSQTQAHQPRTALRLLSGLRRDHEDRAREERSSKVSRRAAGATPTGARPPATVAGAPSASTGASTSSAARTASPRRSRRSSTTPTARPTSRCCTTLDGEKRYILAPQRLTVGMTVSSGEDADIAVGNCLPLARMPVGTVVHNVELQPGRGGQLARSAGASVQLMAQGRRDGDAATALGRDAPGARRVPRDGRRRSATPSTRTSRSARPAASATWACARRRAARR